MSSPAETLVVLVIVVLAGAYLGRRYVRARRAKADGSCGGSCRCASDKPRRGR